MGESVRRKYIYLHEYIWSTPDTNIQMYDLFESLTVHSVSNDPSEINDPSRPNRMMKEQESIPPKIIRLFMNGLDILMTLLKENRMENDKDHTKIVTLKM